MSRRAHQILITGLEDAAVRRVVVRLKRIKAQYHRVSWGEVLTNRMCHEKFDVIIAGHPAWNPSLERFLAFMRSPGSRCRGTGLILLCSVASLEGAHANLGRGVNRVVTVESMDVSLERAVRELLDVAPRVPVHARAWISAAIERGTIAARCATENVSLTGMLVTARLPLPVGSTVTFSLLMPGEATPIRGTGQVLRTADPKHERRQGVGIGFRSFIEADHSRLESIVAAHLA